MPDTYDTAVTFDSRLDLEVAIRYLGDMGQETDEWMTDISRIKTRCGKGRWQSRYHVGSLGALSLLVSDQISVKGDRSLRLIRSIVGS